MASGRKETSSTLNLKCDPTTTERGFKIYLRKKKRRLPPPSYVTSSNDERVALFLKSLKIYCIRAAATKGFAARMNFETLFVVVECFNNNISIRF